jgi:phosphatidylserine/phosphatidylglycerophosphate/cardiolipin synthase-like enzyme
VRAVGGTHVVLLAMHMDQALCTGHMGFGIHRTDHTEDEAYWLKGSKTFAETDPGLRAGSTYGTNNHPVQGFTWSDFTAKPGHRYTYRVVALKGPPAALVPFREVSVEVHTESDAEHGHDVYFNRGAAASQEYSRRFGRLASLESAPDSDPRWAWLSRGAFEGILAFVARARDSGYGLRVAAYEFRLEPFAAALREARARGVDVQIVYDGNPNTPDRKGHVFPRDDNRATAEAAGLRSLCRERVTRADVRSPPISHHKFVVLLRRGRPVAVLTGSTNFSRGGVFGQSNVVHVVENAAVAASYLRCWELIAGNPEHRKLEAELAALNEVPEALPRKGTSCIFSPQPSLAALDWYTRLARETRGALFMTFAFGMGQPFRDAYRDGTAPLRYALMEDLLASGIRKAAREQAQAEMTALRRLAENRFAVGNRIKTNAFDRWVAEKLTGLNVHVQFIHTKFLLADPLGTDPIVVTGSANFSKASTDSNDENMLVVRGDTRVADIYLGEYMRLWNHYAFREWLAARSRGRALQFNHLDTTDKWWRRYFGDTAQSRQRAYFAGVAR